MVIKDSLIKRDKAIWLLRKYTSLTYISKMYQHWVAFSDGYEIILNNPPKGLTLSSWEVEQYKTILDKRILFERASVLLRVGDRNAYLTLSGAVEFSVFDRTLSESGGDLAATGYDDYDYDNATGIWLDYHATRRMAKKLASTLASLGDFQLWTYEGILFDDGRGFLNFPGVFSKTVVNNAFPLIRVNEEFPNSGVWEPISKNDFEHFTDLDFSEKQNFVSPCCVNYFIQGDRAPKIEENVIEDPMETRQIDGYWRLLWEDQRYEDGTIPDEEKYYFAKP